jgi:hypothetical protein
MKTNPNIPSLAHVMVVLTVLLVLGSSRAASQSQFRISVEASKSEFFEGEPIYLLIRTVNTGHDTAWVMPPDLGRRSMTLKVTRAEGSLVSELAGWVDYFYPPGWRGIPIAPGSSRFEIAVLQNHFGEDGIATTPIYPRHLRTGPLEIVAQYNPALPDGDQTSEGVVTSKPLRFTIRPRRPNEETVYRDVAAIRSLAWQRETSAGYASQLVALIARRQAADSTDSFVPFLLSHGVATADAIGSRFDDRTKERLYGMRLGAARSFRHTPAGALTALAALSSKPDQASQITAQLGPSLTGEIVRERQDRRRRPKTK